MLKQLISRYQLSGWDGVGRLIQEYGAGETDDPSHQLAAEEFITVTPICPDEVPRTEATWNVQYLTQILAQVISAYDIDLTRICECTHTAPDNLADERRDLSGYSMGAWGSFNLLLELPNTFAAALILSGSTGASTQQLQTLEGNSIRVYYGELDRADLIASITGTQQKW